MPMRSSTALYRSSLAVAISTSAGCYFSPPEGSSFQQKLINTCRNCSQTFRIGQTPQNYCSLDCFTCHSMMERNGCYSSPNPEAQAIKEQIYEFQQQIDTQDTKVQEIATERPSHHGHHGHHGRHGHARDTHSSHTHTSKAPPPTQKGSIWMMGPTTEPSRPALKGHF
mmetsp:Transcript_16415/g.36863  ORF Transcript_16415/g.36863 Transcript_16415/m.36863 type:complete len:168 (-) Transcript_16415:200-703(-)